MLLDYGYRSECCYAAIRIGSKKVKGTNTNVKIWICCKCGKKDVALLEYTKDGKPSSTKAISPVFAKVNEEQD